MNIILLSGGSGKRLWPLSNGVRSKQFIKLFRKDRIGADGELYESMVQRVYHQLRQALPEASVTVATSRSQVSAIRNQLGDSPRLSVEPCHRDTFPAIALAAASLHDKQGVDMAEPVVVCPVDPYVEEDYFIALRRLGELVVADGAQLTLMGIRPTYPSEKYGYILPEWPGEVARVKAFKEKPDARTAAAYICDGALWNGGIFACRLRYLLERAHELLDFAGYDDLLGKYASLEKISFDYAVVEKEPDIQVMRFGGIWKDIGTWNTLTEAMHEQSIGKAYLDGTCENTHVLNELDVPVVCMGLKDVVVAASVEGVLVSDKEQSSYIKPVVDTLAQQVRFAEKSWGSYRVLDVGEESLTVKVTLKAGHQMNYHSHARRDEVWNIVSGEGVALIDGVKRQVRPGDVVELPAGCRHTLMAETELVAIEMQLGQDIDVEDKCKYRLYADKSFGAYDIRGVYPAEVNEEMAYRIGVVFPQVFETKQVAVGHDVRLSGAALKEALVRGLADAGCAVMDIGMCGTEMIYDTVAVREMDGGIMITASHNPQEYNGFKFVLSGSRPPTGAKMQALARIMATHQGKSYAQLRDTEMLGTGKGGIIHENVTAAYIGNILSHVDTVALRPLKVVVNPGNGSAGPVLREMARQLPMEIIMLQGAPDGSFPHGVPNPLLPECRAATAAAVRKMGADLGVAWDGDFDRCFLFDEQGGFVESYYLVGLLAQMFLQKEPGAKIVYDSRCTWNTEEIVREGGGVPVLSPSGHVFFKAKLRETGAVYGGEMSGHHYFRDFACCDSGMLPWLLVTEILSKSGRKLSELIQERRDKFPISGEINCQVADAEAVMARVEEKYGADGKVTLVDGLSVEMDTWRFNLRKSNTEEVLRLNIEAHDSKRLCDLKTQELMGIIVENT